MRLLAVSQRIDYYPDRNELRDALDQRLVKFLAKAGFQSVPVPNCLLKSLDNLLNHDILDNWLTEINPQGIVLSGGNNIGQYPSRDLTETRLLDYSKSKKIPLLGICRGMQIIANFSKIKLHPVQGHVNCEHLITGEINRIVNSFHNFSINECSKNYQILARSKDGEIEAIRHLSLPWEGWMWHPEREDIFKDMDLNRLKDLFRE